MTLLTSQICNGKFAKKILKKWSLYGIFSIHCQLFFLISLTDSTLKKKKEFNFCRKHQFSFRLKHQTRGGIPNIATPKEGMTSNDAHSLAKKLVEAVAEQDKLRGTISLLENQLQKRNTDSTELAKAKSEISKLQESLKQKDAQIEDQKKEIDQIKQSSASKLDKLKEEGARELEALRNQVQELKSQHETLKKEKETEIQQTNIKFDQKITSLQQEHANVVENHSKEITTVRTEKDQILQAQEKKQEIIKSLEAQVSQLTKEKDELSQQLQAKTAVQQIQGLTNEVRGVVEKTTELEAETKSIKEQNEKLIKKIDKLKIQLKVYQEEKVAAGKSGVPPPVGRVTLVFTDVQGRKNSTFLSFRRESI